MGTIIVHHKGVYNLYTTIADGFYFEGGLTLKQLKYYIKEEYGKQGVRELPQRLERAHKTGTSSLLDKSLTDTLTCNRAGKNEAQLSVNQCIKQFLTIQEKGEKL